MLSGSQDEHRSLADAPGDPAVADCCCAYLGQQRKHDHEHQRERDERRTENRGRVSHRKEVPHDRYRDRADHHQVKTGGRDHGDRVGPLCPEEGWHPRGRGGHERSEDDPGDDRRDRQRSFERRTKSSPAATSFDIAGKETRHNDMRKTSGIWRIR